MKSNKVFLSYVRENQPIVQYIDQILTDYGIDIITDYRNMRGGYDWQNMLRELIENSGHFIPCFSKEFSSRERTVLYRELDYAIECVADINPQHNWIIPVRINECEIPKIRIRPQVLLTNLHYIDLFPPSQYFEGIENIVKSIDEDLVSNPQERLASPNEIDIFRKLGFDMSEYTCNERGDIRFNMRREYWSQSEWMRVSPEVLTKLQNYITAIVTGTREGILIEMRLSLAINDHDYVDDAYDAFLNKCNELCLELCNRKLTDEIISDINQARISFNSNIKFRPHVIYLNEDYMDKGQKPEGLNINMWNEYCHMGSNLKEKPSRFRFHVTKFSYTL